MAKHRSRRRNASDEGAELSGGAGGRKTVLSLLPAAPGLLGVATLALAATGAVTVGAESVPAQTTPDNAEIRAAYAGASSGSTAITSSAASVERERAVSRDSQREALQDTADEDLQDAAEAQAKERNAALAQLAASAEQRAAELTSNAWALPIDAGGYDLTATFGESSSMWSTTHTGLDFAASSGTPIKSVANGVVSSTAYDGSYGNKTVVTLEDGTEIWYCHQTSFSVSPGDQVTSGQEIGVVGATGNVTGPHLHLEVRPGAGDPVDPFSALSVHGLSP